MAHGLVLGVTESGKSTLAKILAKGLRKKGLKIAVLDPLRDPGWDCDFITSDPDAFLEYAKKEQNHILFVDEGGNSIGRYNDAMEWLTTTSRHWGHSTIIICHRWQQLSVTLRTQVSIIYLFACAEDDCMDIANQWRCKALLKAATFQEGDFYVIRRFGKNQKGRVDFASQNVTLTDELGSPGLPESSGNRKRKK